VGVVAYGSALDELSQALDGLIAAGAGSYADGSSIEALHREMSRFEAFVTEASAAFDAAGEWAADGAKTAAAWIATRCRLPRDAARRRVRLGRTLARLPMASDAWREGRIGSDQAKDLARARRHRSEEAMARDEALLVSYAEDMRFEDFHRALSYWQQLADPDGCDDAEAERKARRDVYLQESISGMWLGQMTLDPISGAIVSGELRRLEDELFEADCAEAAERLGRRPTIDEFTRTAAQRRADALVEMASRSASTPADAQRPAPLFSVLVGYETMHGRICELEHGNGTVLAPSALDPWMDSAYFERALFGLGTRIEVSTRARLFSGGTRRAIELRDRRCTHPYCDAPAELCQGDHIDPYSHGGETTQENGRLLCGFHNRLRNQTEGGGVGPPRAPPGPPAA
jgi:hypothetical protein